MNICTIDGCKKYTIDNRKICSMHKERYRNHKSYNLPEKNNLQENGLMICKHHGLLNQEQIQFRKTRRKFSVTITQACKLCANRSRRKKIIIHDDISSRICKRCNKDVIKKDYSDYEWNRPSPWCLECKKEKQNKINKIKSEKGQLTINKKRHRLKTNFDLTLEEFDQMKESQGNLCAICNNPETMTVNGITRELSVDHCHESEKNGVMKIRGLLCRRCNNALGMFKDSISLLQEAIEYLKR